MSSVAALYSVSSERLQAFLLDFDIDEHYRRKDPPRTGDQELRLVFEAEFRCTPAPLDRVYWFHLTRAAPGQSFSEGLLPLSSSLDRVWQSVLAPFRGTPHEPKLLELQRTGVPSFHYAAKVGAPIHAGPYAMLVREVASRSKEIGNHDYLWLPEIVEDICNGYMQKHGQRLHEILVGALAPTVVKFWSAKHCGLGCVESALYYLYLTAHNHHLTLYANTCFDGENEAVPPEQIVSVEVLAA